MTSTTATPTPTNDTTSSQVNFFERVSNLPILRDLVTELQSNPLTSKVINQFTYLTNYFPKSSLNLINSFGNKVFDLVETSLPTSFSYNSVKIPVTEYSDLISSNLAIKLQQSSNTINSLQSSLNHLLTSLPKDYNSASDALFKEIESLSTFVATQRKQLPAHAQPLLDRLQDSFNYIKTESTKPDVPVGTKATVIFSYSKDQLTPLLADAIHVFSSLVPKKVEEETSSPVVVEEEETTAPVVEKGEKVNKGKKSSRVNNGN